MNTVVPPREFNLLSSGTTNTGRSEHPRPSERVQSVASPPPKALQSDGENSRMSWSAETSPSSDSDGDGEPVVPSSAFLHYLEWVMQSNTGKDVWILATALACDALIGASGGNG